MHENHDFVAPVNILTLFVCARYLGPHVMQYYFKDGYTATSLNRLSKLRAHLQSSYSLF